MKKMLSALALTAILTITVSTKASAEPYLGEILTVAFNFCPIGTEPAAGQLIPINQNTALFSLLGTTYGGDGIINFQLPNIKQVLTVSRAPLMSCIATAGIFPPRN